VESLAHYACVRSVQVHIILGDTGYITLTVSILSHDRQEDGAVLTDVNGLDTEALRQVTLANAVGAFTVAVVEGQPSVQVHIILGDTGYITLTVSPAS